MKIYLAAILLMVSSTLQVFTQTPNASKYMAIIEAECTQDISDKQRTKKQAPKAKKAASETPSAGVDKKVATKPSCSSKVEDKTKTLESSESRIQPQQSTYEQLRKQLARTIYDNLTSGGNASRPSASDLTEDVIRDSRIQIAGILAHKVNQKKSIETSVEMIKTIAANDFDKQIGASSNGSGTTSITEKGGIARIINWAVENGGATRDINGTTVTINFNPIGLSKAIFESSNYLDIATGQDSKSFLKGTASDEGLASRILRRTNVGLTFDTTRSGDSPMTFVGDKRQLESITVKTELINKRNPASKTHIARWANFFKDNRLILNKANSLIDKMIDDDQGVITNQKVAKWFDQIITGALGIPSSTDEASSVRQIENLIENAPLPEFDDSTKSALKNLLEIAGTYQSEKEEIYDEIKRGSLLTVQYTNFRNVSEPDRSNFKLIYEDRLLNSLDLTFNSSITIHNSLPNNLDLKRIRDFSFALQVDYTIREKELIKNERANFLTGSVLSFSGMYERQPSDVAMPDGTMATGSKGDIAIGQIKLSIPFLDTGLTLPISLTFANRSSLIKERFVRGNFGLTFDLDKLFARSLGL